MEVPSQSAFRRFCLGKRVNPTKSWRLKCGESVRVLQVPSVSRVLQCTDRLDFITAHDYRRLVSNPTFQFALCNLYDHLHAGRAGVEAWDRLEGLPAVPLEDVCVLDRDLLQRLEAVGGEAGR